MWQKITNSIKFVYQTITKLKQIQTFTPHYRLVEINLTESNDYVATIQFLNKNLTFQITPEEILANDDMVDRFAPRDIRALTYLGYLSINSPKYKILAQRLSEKNDKVLFALQKKGQKQVVMKTADEILKEKEILRSLHAEDAHTIGYTVATESLLSEKKQKEDLKKAHMLK